MKLIFITCLSIIFQINILGSDAFKEQLIEFSLEETKCAKNTLSESEDNNDWKDLDVFTIPTCLFNSKIDNFNQYNFLDSLIFINGSSEIYFYKDTVWYYETNCISIGGNGQPRPFREYVIEAKKMSNIIFYVVFFASYRVNTFLCVMTEDSVKFVDYRRGVSLDSFKEAIEYRYESFDKFNSLIDKYKNY